MSSNTRTQRRYDHRLRELVQTTGDIELATRYGVPRSTARGWLAHNSTELLTLDVPDLGTIQFQQEVLVLRRRIARFVSLLRLVIIVLKVSGFSLSRTRLAEGTTKRQLLRAIERSRSHFPLRTLLRVIGSRAYLHAVIDNFSRRILAWSVAERCDSQVTAQLLLEASQGMTSDKPLGSGRWWCRKLQFSRG